MNLFDFLKRKENFSDKEIEKEYAKAQKVIQSRNMPSLNRAIVRYAKDTCAPQKGDDILSLKSDFIHYCSFTSRMNRYYYSFSYKKGKFNKVPLWCQKWQDNEQRARLQAQKMWREMLSRTR